MQRESELLLGSPRIVIDPVWVVASWCRKLIIVCTTYLSVTTLITSLIPVLRGPVTDSRSIIGLSKLPVLLFMVMFALTGVIRNNMAGLVGLLVNVFYFIFLAGIQCSLSAEPPRDGDMLHLVNYCLVGSVVALAVVLLIACLVKKGAGHFRNLVSYPQSSVLMVQFMMVSLMTGLIHAVHQTIIGITLIGLIICGIILDSLLLILVFVVKHQRINFMITTVVLSIPSTIFVLLIMSKISLFLKADDSTLVAAVYNCYLTGVGAVLLRAIFIYWTSRKVMQNTSISNPSL